MREEGGKLIRWALLSSHREFQEGVFSLTQSQQCVNLKDI